MKLVIYPKDLPLRCLVLVGYLSLSLCLAVIFEPYLVSFFQDFTRNSDDAKKLVTTGLSLLASTIWLIVIVIFVYELFRPGLTMRSNDPTAALAIFPILVGSIIFGIWPGFALFVGESFFDVTSKITLLNDIKFLFSISAILTLCLIALPFYFSIRSQRHN